MFSKAQFFTNMLFWITTYSVATEVIYSTFSTNLRIKKKILKDVDWEILTVTKYFKKLQWAETWIIFPNKKIIIWNLD